MLVLLSIGKLGASSDQLAYYERQVAAGIEDYYAGRGELPGRWIGGGCGGLGLGLSGRVSQDGFTRAMTGCHPGTGERLRPAHGRAKVAAFDLTFSAPKSVSVLFAVGDRRTAGVLQEAHEQAVEAAVAYVEREACFTRRGRNGGRRVRADGFVAAAYRHRLSRAGDPQLHTHVVVANMTRAEGRWTSLEAHGLYEHRLAAGAVYRAVLRAEVSDRLPWVCWRPAGRGLFEIEGVSPGVLREFSRRRVEIEERALELVEVGAEGLSRERMEGIALATRRAKRYGVDGARWREEARARAAEHGLGECELEQLTSRRAPQVVRSPAGVVGVAAARLSGPGGLTAKHNTFGCRHVIAELAGDFAQGASMAELDQASEAYLGHHSVVFLGGDGVERRYTTGELLACEEAIVEGVRRRVGKRVAVLSPAVVKHALQRAPVDLNDEQAAVVRMVAGGGNGVDVVRALAGTGKTRVLGALASCYRKAGHRVIGVAPTGRAARELGEATDRPAYTLHGLVAALEGAEGLGPDTVILLDEAGMAPTRHSATLFAAAQRAGAKVIAAGDGGQLPSVKAGGWFSAIGRELGGPELRIVMRQREPAERAALQALHDGRASEYLALKQQQGTLTAHAEERSALAEVLKEWDAARLDHGLGAVVMIARDNATRGRLNQAARAALVRDGTLGRDALVIAGREFRVGERVIARRNDRHRDVANGTIATVVGIDHLTGALTIRPAGGGTRKLDATYVTNHLEHAYALTGHGSQGATVEWAAVVAQPTEFTAEWAYTVLSRARGSTQIHVIAGPSSHSRERKAYSPQEPAPTIGDALSDMRKAMMRRQAEPLAIEQPGPQDVPLPELHTRRATAPGQWVESAVERSPIVEPATDPAASQKTSTATGWRALRQHREWLQRGLHL